MTQIDEFKARLDRLLVFWYENRPELSVGRGYNKGGTIPYQTPCHWDSRNGAADDLAERQQWTAINAVIERVPDEPESWRLALMYEAQRLTLRAAVYSYSRLPVNEELLEILVLEARNKLAAGLLRAGLL